MLTPPIRPMRIWGGFWARLPPPQWDDFLIRHPEQDALDAEVVDFLPDWLEQIQPIQDQCLALGHLRDERDSWQMADLDTMVPPSEGFDCEDHALTVRALAHRDLGFPLGAMKLAICETTEQHAVLLIATLAGEMVLDNGHVWTELGPWHEYPCKWLYVWGSQKWGRAMESDRRGMV
jgi:predicted transglutaminase-like cysteine proteinase